MLINLSCYCSCVHSCLCYFPQWCSQAPFLDLIVHLQYLHSDSDIQCHSVLWTGHSYFCWHTWEVIAVVISLGKKTTDIFLSKKSDFPELLKEYHSLLHFPEFIWKLCFPALLYPFVLQDIWHETARVELPKSSCSDCLFYVEFLPWINVLVLDHWCTAKFAINKALKKRCCQGILSYGIYRLI